MALPEPLRETLDTVAAAMCPAEDPWWVIGSAAITLHGVALADVQDVDILLSERDARVILPRLGLRVEAGRGDGQFRSAIFARLGRTPLSVEFMAGLHHAVGNEIRRLSPVTREEVRVGAARLFVPSVREMTDILHAFGREKDVARAALLARQNNSP